MKKTVLKGLAMAAVAFAAVLTSCSKEELNIDVKPNNAKIYFNPSVVDPIANATVSATFTGAETLTGNPNIAAGTTTINATAASGATGSTTVNYDAVEAGATATYSPVIYLSDGLFKLVEVSKTSSEATYDGIVDAGHSHNGSKWFLNQSDYSAKFVASWNKTDKTIVPEDKIVVKENSTQLQSYLKGLSTEVKVEGSEEFEVSAWEMIRTVYTVTTETINYNIVSVENEDFVVGSVTIVNPLAKVVVKEVRAAIPGHEGHYEHGHSHGAGTNAGGGIGWAE